MGGRGVDTESEKCLHERVELEAISSRVGSAAHIICWGRTPGGFTEMVETQPFHVAGPHRGRSGGHAKPAAMESPSGGAAGRRSQARPHADHDCCHIVNKRSSGEGGNHVLPLKEARVTRGRRQPPPTHTAGSQPAGPLIQGTPALPLCARGHTLPLHTPLLLLAGRAGVALLGQSCTCSGSMPRSSCWRPPAFLGTSLL